MSQRKFSLSANAHKWHKRLMHVVGIQLLIWAISGLYMVSINIHSIHGDDRVRSAAPVDVEKAIYPIDEVFKRYPELLGIKLKQILNQPYLEVRLADMPYRALLQNAETGQALQSLSKAQIEQIALNRIVTDEGQAPQKIKSIELLNTLPDYVGSLKLSGKGAAYEVSFDTWDNLQFYIQAQTGEIITKRHSLWHVFDWMWRLHIMDYDDGENVDNWLLQASSVVALVALCAGVVLLWHRKRFLKQSSLESTPTLKRILMLHKYLALIVFAQLFIWLASGLYLSAMSKPDTPTLVPPKIDWQAHMRAHTTFAQMLQDHREFLSAELHNVFARPYILLTEEEGYHRNFASTKYLVSLLDGRSVSISQSDISAFFAQNGLKIQDAKIIEGGESELRGEQNRVWKVNEASDVYTYYFDAQSGQALNTLSTEKRIYDFMLRLHFMDYWGAGHFNHFWNIVFSAASLLLALSAFITFILRLNKRRTYKRRFMSNTLMSNK
ncbi:PepSY domain-containing protein [Glaciecola siphonariae]|uniref:PepSY domain-containing protein n=1 Tax=Glaciecola siphonariae TaxID=521012 RepID=A0ABV9LTA5_9ALTE